MFDGDATFESLKVRVDKHVWLRCIVTARMLSRVVLRNLSRLQHGEVKVLAADVARLGVSMCIEVK